MSKRIKERQTLDDILASCSDTLFPAQMGKAHVTVESKGSDGDTALHVLCWRGNSYGIKLLVEAGADVDAIGDMSETPLHIALRKGDPEVVAVLLDSGANRDIRSEFGKTPRDIEHEGPSEIKALFARS